MKYKKLIEEARSQLDNIELLLDENKENGPLTGAIVVAEDMINDLEDAIHNLKYEVWER